MEHNEDMNPEYFCLPGSDVNTFFSSDNRDPRSELPLSICSLLLRYMLPQLEVERYVLYRRNSIERCLQNLSMSQNRRIGWLHVTGSSIEGFSVPPYRERPQSGEAGEIPGRAGEPFYQTSDIDGMTEVAFLPIEVRPTPGRLYIDETRASHVGYVRLALDGPNDTYGLSFPVRNICRAVNEGDKTTYFLLNRAFVDQLASVANANVEQSDTKVNVSGPAVNMEPKYSGQRGLDLDHDIDMVPALPLRGHPPAFHRWLERVSRRGAFWPSRNVVNEIRDRGRCFVVNTGHASSAERDLEFRLSFSDPERKLAQTVTPVQRKVYLFVKLLQKCYLKEPKVIVTYHLKTIMFWLLEESRPGDWTEETIFKQVLRFLDKIEEFLEEREIPSYFYPENNLVSHTSPEHMEETLSSVRRIRSDPLRHLHGIDEKVWMGFSTLTPLSSLHQPVLKVMKGSEYDVRLKMANSLVQQARHGTVRDILWPLRCADLLRDIYSILRDIMSTSLEEETPKAEERVTWSSSDWLTLATLSVFAALHQEENWWIFKMTQGGFEVPREDNCREGTPFTRAVALLLPGRRHAAFMLKMFLAADRGNSIPLHPLVTSKYALLAKREELQARRETSGNNSYNDGAAVGGARPKDTAYGTHRPERMASAAPDLPSLVTTLVMPMAEIHDAGIAAVAAYGGPAPQASSPERIAGQLRFRETYGSCPTLFARLQVPILESIGYLLHHWPRLAWRCARWMHQLTTRLDGWGDEAAPSVPLADAPQFLKCLPAASAALLSRSCARAALLPLSAFMVFITVLLVDEPFRRQVVSMEVGDEQLEEFFDKELQLGDATDLVYDDVMWTNVVMKLCLREMKGQDVHSCQREVKLLRGGDKGERAKQILKRFNL